jgi:hypothetical protein
LDDGFEKILRRSRNDRHVFGGFAREPNDEGGNKGANENGIRQPLDKWFALG